MSLAAAHAGVFSGIVGGNDAHTLAAAAQAGRQGASRELVAIGRAEQWLNSPRLTPESLARKVVLVDFWTYTCINWLRTLPYLRAWIRKYKQDLVLIGVHTPEFPFERDLVNVRRAVQQLRIEYPVVIDNNYSIWRAFKNQYWPALYLLDARGRLRAHQFGEGDYDNAERSIQRLLQEAGLAGVTEASTAASGAGFEAAADWTNLQ
jgi:thiol-disulfide isomerase/thioredoxin